VKAARVVRPGGRWKRTRNSGHLASGLPEPRLPGARRDTALTDPTPVGLAGLIGRAEQAARHAPAHPKDPA
jgi:hypothetical protein